MTLKQLRFFLAVLRAGSFTGPARTLHVAQPAIGVQIGHLEDELGVRLLTRHSRGVRPTEAGERLARDAARFVAEGERIRRDVMAMGREPRGRVALGLTGTAAAAFGGRLVEACRRGCPELDLTVMEGESRWLADRLAQGRLDLAVTDDPPADGGDEPEALATEPLHLVAPPGHPLAEGPKVPLPAALAADLVLPPAPSPLYRLLDDAARAAGSELRSICAVGSVVLTKDFVARGFACAVMPYGAVRNEVEDGRLAAPRIVDPGLALTHYLTCSESRPGTRALDAVRAALRTVAAELADMGAGGRASPADVSDGAANGRARAADREAGANS